MELKNKKITVIGLGKSGLAVALLLHELGAEPRVTDSARNPDVEKNAEELSKRNIHFELGSHTEDFINGSELAVISPGVSNESHAVKWAEEKGVPVIGEIELAYSLCPAPIIAISGTNGKSTVVTLTGELVKNSGKETVVCGNIGTPFSGEVLKLHKDAAVVLEISSFQLERIKTFRPMVSCLLNISQDHLDRYPGMEEYFEAKKRIFANQGEGDYAVLNFDSPRIRALKEFIKPKTLYFSRYRLPKEFDGAYVENSEILIRCGGKFQWVASLEDMNLEGDHNTRNYLASVLCAFIFGVQPESMWETLSRFKALSHRFETVALINGVRFIDDSKATNVDSVIKALDCCHSPVILIAGGRDKGSDYKPLVKSIREKVKDVILLGEAKEKIKEDIASVEKPLHFVEDLNKAVELAFEKASRGNIVLLSPICSSFDMFKDYKERGEVFREAVKRLAGERVCG